MEESNRETIARARRDVRVEVLPAIDLGDPAGWPKLRGWDGPGSDRVPA